MNSFNLISKHLHAGGQVEDYNAWLWPQLINKGWNRLRGVGKLKPSVTKSMLSNIPSLSILCYTEVCKMSECLKNVKFVMSLANICYFVRSQKLFDSRAFVLWSIKFVFVELACQFFRQENLWQKIENLSVIQKLYQSVD